MSHLVYEWHQTRHVCGSLSSHKLYSNKAAYAMLSFTQNLQLHAQRRKLPIKYIVSDI